MNETPFHNDPLEYEIEQRDDGARVASNPVSSLTVLPDGETRIFKRRAIKTSRGHAPEFRSVLVGELDGVRVYISDGDVILTRQDLKL